MYVVADDVVVAVVVVAAVVAVPPHPMHLILSQSCVDLFCICSPHSFAGLYILDKHLILSPIQPYPRCTYLFPQYSCLVVEQFNHNVNVFIS